MTNHDYPDSSRTIRQYLLQAMRTGEYAHGDRLPRESVLAEKLGISRTQLRDILASLEREGFITRRHGVGTLINRYVFNVPTRMDIEVGFSDMIRPAPSEPRGPHRPGVPPGQRRRCPRHLLRGRGEPAPGAPGRHPAGL